VQSPVSSGLMLDRKTSGSLTIAGEEPMATDMPTRGISGIVHGQRRISADTALRLARYSARRSDSA
jgi:plasmid maintenance system antidote protein VapI